MKNWTLISGLILLMFLAVGCGKSDNQKAKERVLQKQDITEAVKTRKVEVQPINLDKIPGDIEEFEKVLLMTLEEMHARLGSFSLKATLKYVTGNGEKTLNLNETQEFSQAKNGDFRLNLYNTKSQGFELYWRDGNVYERMGASPFRKTSSTGKHLYWREKAHQNLNRFYKYFRGHLIFSPSEPVIHEGRPAVKIAFSLNPGGKTPEADLETRYNFPNQYALSVIASEKILNNTRKKISRRDKAEGFVIIDKEKSILLAYSLDGTYGVAVRKELQRKEGEDKSKGLGKEMLFSMTSEFKLGEIGADIKIVPPKVAKPIERDVPPPNVKQLLPKGSKLNPELKEILEQTNILPKPKDAKKKAQKK